LGAPTIVNLTWRWNMVRLVQRWEVVYGHFADFVTQIESANAVSRERGWPEFTLLAPFSGKANEVVLMSDYDDLATYKAVSDAAWTDAEFFKEWQTSSQYVVQGSGTFEVLEPAPHLA
jgi:hypothetical protein